ncbi:LysR family transcriptional regulator [Acinetobacter sp. WCHAc060033]|uniref:LysR family transcriptional regulator n=1 Tax=Acinetobacter wuhouensis TaxID=1879050 RepID=A0A3G2T3T0_9GAMM|nr:MULTISPECIES: LysR family transcriptional regulator [Acinetobacter]AYO54731.1 LysR family transcriptional regulator [Acinetobacter wuhouensis]RZG88005.1 LysR family transcriptional regulator [Acinetobacter sp. WCHAc060033]
MDKLDCIKTFYHVVEHQNFSKAARALNISRDLVAKRISYLETHLNATLVLRTTRKMNLTETGEKFYQHCKIILSEYEIAQLEIVHDHFYPEGSLKINAPASFSRHKLNLIVSEFILSYPDIEIELALSDEVKDIYDHHYDLTLRIGTTLNDNFENIILQQFNLNFYATPEYYSKYGIPQKQDELINHHLLMYFHNKPENKIYLSHHGEPVTLHCFPKFKCNDGDFLVDLALQHQGIVYLPEFLVTRYIESKQLIKCLEDYKSQIRYFYVACPKNQKLSRRARLFVDFLSKKLN